MKYKDDYTVLGVPRDAIFEQIKKVAQACATLKDAISVPPTMNWVNMPLVMSLHRHRNGSVSSQLARRNCSSNLLLYPTATHTQMPHRRRPDDQYTII